MTGNNQWVAAPVAQRWFCRSERSAFHHHDLQNFLSVYSTLCRVRF